jgi:hypothetical protein
VREQKPNEQQSKDDMGRQYNKVEKRKRRDSYLKRKNTAAKSKSAKSKAAPKA